MSEHSSRTTTPSREEDPAAEVTRMMMSGLSGTDDLFTVPSTPTSTASRAIEGGLESSRMNATLHARRISQRLNLAKPYSRELEEFAVEDLNTRQLVLFGRTLLVEQKLNSIVVSSGPYKVEQGLEDNVKKYCVAVLLSPKLDTYKGAAPTSRVLAVIKRIGSNVPSNLETDAHVYKTVKQHISDELTQTRAAMKKKIAASVKESQSVYELALAMVEGTQCTVSVEMCARLALLRKVYNETGKSDTKYWDHVDERLQLIREHADGAPEKIAAVFTVALKEDHIRYGRASESYQSQPRNAWQNSVDDVMDEGAAQCIATRGADDD
ncbi:hypothetical protein NMY22_g2416 [Coprinellus aureogranulatus]|nr:hypothetical protein NMY22_g2416 [Coprinellus aureogranulatus]